MDDEAERLNGKQDKPFVSIARYISEGARDFLECVSLKKPRKMEEDEGQKEESGQVEPMPSSNFIHSSGFVSRTMKTDYSKVGLSSRAGMLSSLKGLARGICFKSSLEF